MMDFRLSLRTVEGMSAFIGKLLSVVSPRGVPRVPGEAAVESWKDVDDTTLRIV
jgi:hypothetical protein